MIGAASIYAITGQKVSTSPLRTSNYFVDQQVYNIKGGFVGIGGGIAGGIWKVREFYDGSTLNDPDNDRPLEVIRAGDQETILEKNFGDVTNVGLDEKPYYRYYDSPEYIRHLPSLYASIPDSIIELGNMYAEEQKVLNP